MNDTAHDKHIQSIMDGCKKQNQRDYEMVLRACATYRLQEYKLGQEIIILTGIIAFLFVTLLFY